MLLNLILLDSTHIAVSSHLLQNPCATLLGELLYSIYNWWDCGRKRLIELPKIPLGNWMQPQLFPALPEHEVVDWCISCHSFHISGNLPAFPQSVPFSVLPKCYYKIRPESPLRLHWTVLTHFQKYPYLFVEHSKKVIMYMCACKLHTQLGVFYNAFHLLPFL